MVKYDVYNFSLLQMPKEMRELECILAIHIAKILVGRRMDILRSENFSTEYLLRAIP